MRWGLTTGRRYSTLSRVLLVGLEENKQRLEPDGSSWLAVLCAVVHYHGGDKEVGFGFPSTVVIGVVIVDTYRLYGS